MLKLGIIEESKSPWSSAPVLVRKADGSARMCVDYRDLNNLTKKRAYPISDLNGTFDKMRRARFISKIDLKNAYHQIKISDDSKEMTAFAIEGLGQFQYCRLSFGLCNAPREFQALIEKILGPKFAPFVGAYLDDIYVATEDFDSHLYWLRKVIKALLDAKLTLNRKKCEFCLASLVYLGFRVDAEGLRPDEDKIKPILEYPAPRNIKEVRRFLGMISWYARFIKDVAELKISLNKLLHKNVEWQWNTEQDESFQELKKALMSFPVLARPKFSASFHIADRCQ